MWKEESKTVTLPDGWDDNGMDLDHDAVRKLVAEKMKSLSVPELRKIAKYIWPDGGDVLGLGLNTTEQVTVDDLEAEDLKSAINWFLSEDGSWVSDFLHEAMGFTEIPVIQYIEEDKDDNEQ